MIAKQDVSVGVDCMYGGNIFRKGGIKISTLVEVNIESMKGGGNFLLLN